MLLLDEPTAHVDPDHETRIIATLERLAADRAVVCVAHRPAVIDAADRVVHLDSGRVATAAATALGDRILA